MRHLNITTPPPPGGITPEMGRVNVAVATFGISRSWLYRMAPDYPGLLRKLAGATLVDFHLLRGILAKLPPAPIRGSREAA
jgi:hypothetical protein